MRLSGAKPVVFKRYTHLSNGDWAHTEGAEGTEGNTKDQTPATDEASSYEHSPSGLPISQWWPKGSTRRPTRQP